MALSTQQQADDEARAADYEEEEEDAVVVGVITVNVVGLQYYHGTVTDGEMVTLVREPHNQYDSNAIRVDNVRGQQVGHIERYKAMHLAPLVDNGLATLEGVVPGRTGAKHKMPCEVWIYSMPSMSQAVVTHLEYANQVIRRPGEETASGWRSDALEGGSAVREGGRRKRGTKLAAAASDAQERKSSIDDIFQSMSEAAKKRHAMEADAAVILPLMQHQKEALAWMVQRENSSRLPPFWEARKQGNKSMYRNTLTNFTTDKRPESLRGGLLADDMGLGKTLTVLALVATNKAGATLPPLVDVVEDNNAIVEEDEQEQRPTKKRKQSSGASSSKSLKGKGRATAAAGGTAEGGDGDDGGEALVPRADGPRATLVVCPVSVLSNWTGQLEEHTSPGCLKAEVYHGPDRVRNVKKLSSCDIVFTSYSMLSSEFDDRNSPLKKVKWLRVVLDEAHLVKNPSSKQAKCAVALQAERRWAVTGTPIQNGAKDLFSLMQFLHFEPLNEKAFWNRTIQRPLKSGQHSGFSRLQGLMSCISLRRTKDSRMNGRKLVELPPKIVTVHTVELNEEDRKVYDKMEKDGKRMIQGYIADGTMAKKFAVVLQLILRLRQVCNHSSLCPDMAELLAEVEKAVEMNVASPELLQKMLGMLGDDFDCPICLSPPQAAVITRCAHIFCRRCIERTFSNSRGKCPMCRGELSEADLFTSNQPEEADAAAEAAAAGGAKSSAKVKALISLLQRSREKDPSVKSVVFSQFSSMLKLLEEPLREAGFEFVTLVGSMSLKKREEAIQAFRAGGSSSPTVFLLSLKAAGVGLNLVAASNVFMVDPWWNPAVEEQAQDRVHRLGQRRDVHVFRLVAAGTIEERMLKMQEKKRAYAQIACGKEANDERRQLCMDEVKLLLCCE